MKPIVVIDSNAFVYPDTEEGICQELAKRKSQEIRDEGYIFLPVRPGSSVKVLGLPAIAPESAAVSPHPPILVIDADAGVPEEQRKRLKQEGWEVFVIKPGSRVAVL